MPKATVHGDIHGVFVKTDGRLYRPVRSVSSYPVSHMVNSKECGDSVFSVGDKVVAKHTRCTPFCSVSLGDTFEMWHSHGVYLVKKSTECWEPA